MSFNLEITITGICGFVENSNGDVPRVCVVMPSDIDRNAQDDEPLCPHECYIEQGYGLARFKTSILGQRIEFVVSGQNDPIILPIATYHDVGLIRVSDSGIGDPVNPDIVSMPPGDPLVKAQIMLNEGIVTATEVGGFWAIREGDQDGVRVAHELTVALNDLESAVLWLSPFSGEQPTAVDLKPPTGISTVGLRIVNTCARKIYLPRREAFRDRDFKWYYELLMQSPGASLGNKDLPIPRFLGRHLIGGNNCFPGHLGFTPIP